MRLDSVRHDLDCIAETMMGNTHERRSIHGLSGRNNITRPESTLKKKSNSICYHAAREAVAMQEMIAAHVGSKDNPADLATKTSHAKLAREHLVEKLLYNVYDAA